MARSGRGLGNRPLGGNSSAPNRGPQGATGGGSLGGGAGMARARRPGPNRPHTPGQRHSGRGGNNDPAGITDPANTGITNTLDQDTSTNAFNDMDNYRQGAWGMLNRAGVNQSGMGDAERTFAENRINDWVDQYQGSGLTGDSSVSFEDWMYQHGGQPGAALGATPATGPNTGAVVGPTIGGEPNRHRNPNQWQRWNQQQQAQQNALAGGTTANPSDPEPNRQRNPNQWHRWHARQNQQPQGPAPGTPGGAINPGTEAWRQATFYPSMGQSYQHDWAAATNEQRGYDSRAWRAAGRVMPY